MSMLIMATALSSGSSGWSAYQAEPSRPSSSPAKVKKQDAALLFRLRGEPARQFDHPGGARGVIVGAGMHRAGHRRRQRELLAQAEVVVVRADDHVLVGLARQISGHVVRRSSRSRSTSTVASTRSDAGKANDSRLQVLIDGGLDAVQISCRHRGTSARRGGLHLHEGMPASAGPSAPPNFSQSSGSPW